jgi:hypothetical protein
LVLLVLAFSRYYSTIPFCIWLFGTNLLNIFMASRQSLPNFSYAEFLKLDQHIIVRQRILESGLLKIKRERESITGYMFNSDSDTRKAAPGLIAPAVGRSSFSLSLGLTLPAPRKETRKAKRSKVFDGEISGDDNEDESNSDARPGKQ